MEEYLDNADGTAAPEQHARGSRVDGFVNRYAMDGLRLEDPLLQQNTGSRGSVLVNLQERPLACQKKRLVGGLCVDEAQSRHRAQHAFVLHNGSAVERGETRARGHSGSAENALAPLTSKTAGAIGTSRTAGADLCAALLVIPLVARCFTFLFAF